jgi:tetratricopeptide (TPR) repeat protein
MTHLRYALPFFLLALAACSPMTPRPPDIAATPTAKPAKPAAPTEATGQAEPQETAPPETPPPAKAGKPPKKPAAAPAASHAVTALLEEAEASTASGSLDEAAAALERAIRIQPRNPTLWHKLAEVRLKQHQPGLAEDLAKKSNLLCQDNKALARQNWALIAEARRKKDDAEGAADADAKARQ